MRPALFAAGMLVLALNWLGPLPALAPMSFAAHMTMHMAVVAVASPLIAAGIAGGRFDPVRRAPGMFAPVPAAMVELIIVWAWHAPALHHGARRSISGLALEQGTFLAGGLLVWLAALGGARADRAQRAGGGVLALLLTSMHMTLLGALLALSPRPLYGHGSSAEALDDQHLGGAIMLLIGGASYLAGALWLTATLLARRTVARAARSPLPYRPR